MVASVQIFRQDFRRAAVLALLGILLSTTAQAGGKKAPTPPPSCSIASWANPVRGVIVRKVRTMAFPLPNGKTADLSYDLESMLTTALTQNSSFRKMTDLSTPSYGPCDRHLEIEASLSAFELDATEFGVKFGYSPGGALNPGGLNINTSAKVKIGLMSMDFHVLDCQGNQCLIPVAASADHTLAELNVNLTVDFGVISTGADLMTKTALGSAFRKVMASGIQKIEKASAAVALPWSAAVASVESNGARVIFNAGLDRKIAAGQVFEVYAASQSGLACSVFDVVATLKVSTVNQVSAEADVIQVFNRDVRPGDVVMVSRRAL